MRGTWVVSSGGWIRPGRGVSSRIRRSIVGVGSYNFQHRTRMSRDECRLVASTSCSNSLIHFRSLPTLLPKHLARTCIALSTLAPEGKAPHAPTPP